MERHGEIVDADIVAAAVKTTTNGNGGSANHKELSHSDEQKLQKELESITFYIENDYHELAEKALAEIGAEFGDLPQIAELRSRIGAEAVPEAISVEPEPHVNEDVVGAAFGIDEIRSEFGLEGAEPDTSDDDYDTHFQMGVAYKEMGLMEDAIREFQDAANLAKPDDPNRRFFYCANLLGHCFLQNGTAKHAITWFDRALETPQISDEEHHGLWYELALAYEANGDENRAATYFERIYAENVDFRDVSSRVKDLVATQ